MSRENVEVVRRMYEEWQRGGGTAEAIPVGLFGEDFEWDQSTYPLVGFPMDGVGLDNLLGALEAYWSIRDHYAAEVKELVDAGDNVLVPAGHTSRIPSAPHAPSAPHGRE